LIRVAYLSPDFRNHATSYLLAALIESHDRSRFHVLGLSFGPRAADQMQRRMSAAFDKMIDASGLSDVAAAKALQENGIDIAVDLAGYTEHARPGILARRPAAVQVSYLGYPGTMAAPWIDYIIADRFTIPDDSKPFFSEKVVHLPDTYQANDHKREGSSVSVSRSEVGLPEHGFVFCCFNNAYKIRPGVFDVWMRLLGQVEGSVLWLLLDSDASRDNLRREAERRGVAPHRLVFAPRVGVGEHLARHKLADLFLDTLPYNAHTTASDALRAGVPIVTCMGNSFASRVAASLLHAAGVPEFVTHSLDDYFALALRLARDPALLARRRAALADSSRTLPLFDVDRFRRNIEKAYLMMHERHQAGEQPASFSVT
jgi:predicted O-linked N-acetylglucosamine transferase (SPINDLY family)